MTLLMYARRKEWPLHDVEVDLSHDRVYVEDSERSEAGEGQMEQYSLAIRLYGDLSEEQRARMAHVATRCPVRRTLSAEPRFEETVEVVRG
jgi:putative redox protein